MTICVGQIVMNMPCCREISLYFWYSVVIITCGRNSCSKFTAVSHDCNLRPQVMDTTYGHMLRSYCVAVRYDPNLQPTVLAALNDVAQLNISNTSSAWSALRAQPSPMPPPLGRTQQLWSYLWPQGVIITVDQVVGSKRTAASCDHNLRW